MRPSSVPPYRFGTAHSTLMLASRTTVPQRCASAAMKAANSFVVPPAGLEPSFNNAARTSGRRKCVVNRSIQPCNDRRLRSGRRQQAVPIGRFDAAMAAFIHGGDVGHLRATRLASDSQCAQPAAFNVLEHVGKIVEIHLHLAGEQVGDGRGRAPIGNVNDIRLGQRLEHLADEMRLGAETGRGEVHLAGIVARVGDEVVDGLRRHRRMDHQQQGALRHKAMAAKLFTAS